MAIKLKKDEGFVYLGIDGLLTTNEKKRADQIYNFSKLSLLALNKKIKNADPLSGWHKKGKLFNKIIKQFKINNSEKKFFWLMLNTFVEKTLSERAKKFHIQNDFRTASTLAFSPLKQLKKIGPWGLWREIISSKKTSDDERVAEWIIKQIIKEDLKRDSARPLLKFVRNRLKNIDTTVLNKEELLAKLEEYNH